MLELLNWQIPCQQDSVVSQQSENTADTNLSLDITAVKMSSIHFHSPQIPTQQENHILAASVLCPPLTLTSFVGKWQAVSHPLDQRS